MTIRPLYPSIEPSLNLDFANTKRLDPRITFTRASTGSFIGADGLIKTAAVNEARFDHSPITGESLGLLVEEQRTNLVVQSENFGTTWTTLGLLTFGSGSTLDATAAPNATITADLITEDTTTGEHRISSASIPWAGNTSYTFTIYAKPNGRNRFDLLFGTAGNWSGGRQVAFDLSTGSVIATDGATGTIAAVGNGWYRCRITALSAASPSASAVFLRLIGTETIVTNYTGDGTSGLYLWGAQAEAGAFPTSYIPTTTAAATRSADVASITGSNFSSWYRQDEGSFLGSGRSSDTTNNVSFLMTADDGSLANEIHISRRIGSFLATTGIAASGVSQADMFSSAWATGSEGVIAVGLGTNNCAISFNGQAPVTDASVTLPLVNTLRLGRRSNTFNTWNGTIRRITYWPARLSNSTLQALTL